MQDTGCQRLAMLSHGVAMEPRGQDHSTVTLILSEQKGTALLMMLLSYFHGMCLCFLWLEIMLLALPWTFFSSVILPNGDREALPQAPSPPPG